MKNLVILAVLVCAALLLAGCGIFGGNGGGNPTFTFKSLPTTLDEMKALPEATLKDPYAVAALTVVALTLYETNQGECFKMLRFLKGPGDLSGLEQQLQDRFRGGKYYKVWSFFDGATPENSYTPSRPYRIEVSSNSYSFQEGGWATLYLKSGGADSPRVVKLRKKESTGQWFLNDIQFLGEIRTPASADPWR